MAQRSLLGVPAKDEGDKAWDNVVLWASDPAGPWSDPISLGVYGVFDPGHVVDQQGNRYLYFNKGMMIQLTPDGLATIGDLKIAYECWEYPQHWATECMCLEAPKLVHHDGYYYMASAQGGTGGPSTAHMAIVARSRSVDGPWENLPPTTPSCGRPTRQERWWRQGHGTLIDDIEGNWWFLYTGYENGYTHLGKQSLLLPVEWTSDDWPRVKFGVNVGDTLRKPAGENVGHGMPLSDDFTSETLGIQWTAPRSRGAADLVEIGGGRLRMRAAGDIPGESATQPRGATGHQLHAREPLLPG